MVCYALSEGSDKNLNEKKSGRKNKERDIKIGDIKMGGFSMEYSMCRIGDEDSFLELDEAKKMSRKVVDNYISEVEDEDGKNAINEYDWHIVTAEAFEEDWFNDEKLKKTGEIKAKYKKLAKNNRVLFLEVDWN